jgi:ribosomal protein L22
MSEEPEDREIETSEVAEEAPTETPETEAVSESTPDASEDVAAVDEKAETAVDEDEDAAPVRAPGQRRRRAKATDAEAEAAEPAEKPARRRRAKPKVEAEPEKPAAPAPSRRRAAREPGAAPPVVRAQAKYVRSSARKARLVCDHIRGKSVEEARAILAHTPRAVARDWSKLLESAIANAEHNHELVGEDLYVQAVHADEGPTIRRYRPRAMGRATKIRKRTAHLTIQLTPKD